MLAPLAGIESTSKSNLVATTAAGVSSRETVRTNHGDHDPDEAIAALQRHFETSGTTVINDADLLNIADEDLIFTLNKNLLTPSSKEKTPVTYS